MTRLLALLLGLGIVAAAAQGQNATRVPGPDSGGERYTLQKTDGGYLRVDRHTGVVSFCHPKEGGWTCTLAADERAALEAEIARLQAHVTELEQRARRPRPVLRLPEASEMRRALDYLGRLVRRFVAALGTIRDRVESRLTGRRSEFSPMHDATMRQALGRLDVQTRGRGFTDITGAVRRWLAERQAHEGLVTLFLRHTSASLTIQENADPDVRADLLDALDRLAPQHADYRHETEGPDDMPAHIKTVLSDVSLSIPVLDGEPALGTWQAIYVVEHRAAPHRRQLVLHFIGRFADQPGG